MKKFNKILSTFTKTIDKLENLEAECLKIAETARKKAEDIEIVMNTKISMLNDKKDAVKEEAAAAINVANKIRMLINDKE